MIGNDGSQTTITDNSVINTVAELAELPVNRITAVLQHRADILKQTDAALRAVLSPQETGGFSHNERAALACRIARLNDNERLALFYQRHITAPDNISVSAICNPTFDGENDTQLKAILAFTDLVSTHPKDATEEAINSLKAAGITEPDIVRLAELNAFLAHHIKVIEGCALMVSNSKS